jgi:muramoyltetrapeptide carboxypeptidase
LPRVLCPPALCPDDHIVVVAPSSPFDKERVRKGILWLEERYQVTYSGDLFDRDQGFLAGSDAVRLAELQAAWDHPDAKAIVAARGGYGVTRIIERLDWSRFVQRPRWLVGFSDITALHAGAVARGVAALHAMNVSNLGEADGDARAAWLGALEEPDASRAHHGLGVLRPGEASGTLFGGNLTLLFAEAAAGHLRVPEGCVLLLEDVTETSYRIDRMLTALKSGGYFSRASAIVLGDFTECSPGRHGVPVEAVLEERLGDLGIPVISGLPVGHGQRNEPLALGFRARVVAPASGSGQLHLEPPR